MTDLDMSCNCLTDNRMKFRGADRLCVCKQHKSWCCKSHYTGFDAYSDHVLKIAVKAILG